MKRRTRLLSMLLAGSMTLSLAACGSGSSTGSGSSAGQQDASGAASSSAATKTDDGEPVYGGTFIAFHTGFHNEFDPSCANDRSYNTLMLDSLWNLDWDCDRSEMDFSSSYINSRYMTGQLAESWEVAEDYSTITVHIRDDVYFQDKTAVGVDEQYDIYKGRQMTASDVAYSYNRLLGLDGAPLIQQELTTWTTDLACLDSVEVVDDTTVTFHLNTTDELSVDSFICTFVFICGPEWDELTDAQKTDWHYASGTGAFILTDYITDNTMTFVKNPKYWATDSDGNALPYLDGVKLVQINDSATALASFMSGEIHALISPQNILDTDQAKQLEAGMSADDYVAYKYMNYPTSVTLKTSDASENAPLKDKKVRMAMQYAIDTDAISEYMGYSYEDTAEAVSGIFGVGTSWDDVNSWDSEVLASYTTYDPDYAKELLKEAGYENGFTFDVYIFSVMFNDSMTLAAEYLNKVGITMNLNVVSDIVSMVSVGENKDAPGVSFTLPNTGLYNTSASNAVMAIRSDGSNNRIFAKNDEIDALVDDFAAAKDLDTQIAAAKKLDNAVMDEHYYLLLTHNSQYTNYYRSFVKGLHGEQPAVSYHLGFMYARTWLEQ